MSNIVRRETDKVKVCFKPCTTLNNLYTPLKDKVSLMKRTNIIYSISCMDCDKKYIGKTIRRLETRISEHKRDYKKAREVMSSQNRADRRFVLENMTTTKTALVQHTIETKHRFDFDSVKILDSSNNNHRLSFLEMLHIQSNETVNRRIDIAKLSNVYSGLLAKINNR